MATERRKKARESVSSLVVAARVFQKQLHQGVASNASVVFGGASVLVIPAQPERVLMATTIQRLGTGLGPDPRSATDPGRWTQRAQNTLTPMVDAQSGNRWSWAAE